MSRDGVKRAAALVGLALLTATPAHAGRVKLCNATERPVRSAVIIKEGFSYLSGTWSSRGWYTLSKGECFTIGGGGWGGSRAWGFISIEEQRSEQEIALLEELAKKHRLQEAKGKQNEFLNGLSFYDRLMLYLPGTRQSAALHERHVVLSRALNAPSEATGEVNRWRFHHYPDEKPNPIDEQGMDGTRYKTCLPTGGFSHDTNGLPDEAGTCSGGSRLVQFALEFFVTPDGTLVLTVDRDGVKSHLRY